MRFLSTIELPANGEGLKALWSAVAPRLLGLDIAKAEKTGCSRRTPRNYTHLRAGVTLALLVIAASLRLSAQNNPAAPASKPQPLPFSHKLHTQFLRDCMDCHRISDDGWAIEYPPEEKCMTCHATVKKDSAAIKKLADFAARKEPVPWVQVYEVPDYVYFSHRTHVTKAKLDCETCHGPVRERDVIVKEKPVTMQACVDCHKLKGAPTGCRTCHDTV